MSDPTLYDVISSVIQSEGSTYTDDAADRGGPTKYGVTLATLREVRPGATADDVRNLTEEEARTIYIQRFVAEPGFARIYEPLRTLVVDFGVTSGPRRATRALQLAVGAVADGIMGPETHERLAGSNVDTVYASVLRQYFDHFVSVVLNDSDVREFRQAHPNTQLKFLRGWVNRASKFVR